MARLVRSKLFRIGLLAGFLTLFSIPLLTLPARALANPDAINIPKVYVFRDVLVPGDELIYVRYNVTYGTVPTSPAMDNFQMTVYDVGGVAFAPIPTRALLYYQENITSIYLTPTDVSAYGITWGDALQIHIEGSPTVFPILTPGVNQAIWTLAASDYHEHSEMTPLMLAEAQILETDWGITILDSGLLNTTGQTYFTYAINNFGTMCPDAVSSTLVYPSANLTDYGNLTYADSLHANQGPRLRAAIQDMANGLHVSEDWMAIWLTTMAYLTTAGVVYGVTKDPGVSMMASFPVVVIMAWLGVGSSMLTIVIAAAIVGGILFGIHFILARMW